MSDPTEFQRFDAGVRKILSVSHDELVKREEEWKRKRAALKKTRAEKKVSNDQQNKSLR
jgi:hypothetical protein